MRWSSTRPAFRKRSARTSTWSTTSRSMVRCGSVDTARFTGALDTTMGVEKLANYRLATIIKNNDGEEDAQFAFTLESHILRDLNGEPIGTAPLVVPMPIPEKAEAKPKGKTRPASQRIALSALDEAIYEAGEYVDFEPHPAERPWSSRATSGATTPSRWASPTRPTATDKQKAFHRAFDRLVADKVVGVWEPYVWPTAPPETAPHKGEPPMSTMSAAKRAAPQLNRETFRTSRLLDFCSEKELQAQTGHETADWPLVIVKEGLDNALDACEDIDVAPEVAVRVDAGGITIADNGPGIPEATVRSVLDFAIRVSSREAYSSPTRGAQGNALKTLLAMPFVLSGGTVAPSRSRPKVSAIILISPSTTSARRRSSAIVRKRSIGKTARYSRCSGLSCSRHTIDFYKSPRTMSG